MSNITDEKLNKAGDIKSIIMNGCRNINSDGISNFEYDKVNKINRRPFTSLRVRCLFRKESPSCKIINICKFYKIN